MWKALKESGGSSVCAQDGIVCDSKGKVLELPVENAGWQCDVQQLAPLANLTQLRTLELIAMPQLTGMPPGQRTLSSTAVFGPCPAAALHSADTEA
jgi:hypothetical protein